MVDVGVAIVTEGFFPPSTSGKWQDYAHADKNEEMKQNG
jgi:hypothetical protein